ncbi:MAG TPA: cytochrome c class I [Cyclobacteriaceae bacterium]|nr:cytochrome c class I [Cyclobacteriaceae bacterium]
MKKTIYGLAIVSALMMVSCGGKKESANKEEYVANHSAAEKPAAVDLVAQGDALVKSSDCKTCHHPVNKLIGPSHTDVAKKYEFNETNVKLLADKIIKGGSGTWGEIPMTGHPDITQSDAEKMAQYVLSLDGEKLH